MTNKTSHKSKYCKPIVVYCASVFDNVYCASPEIQDAIVDDQSNASWTNW